MSAETSQITNPLRVPMQNQRLSEKGVIGAADPKAAGGLDYFGDNPYKDNSMVNDGPPSVALVVPALEEGRTISKVVLRLSSTLPKARVVVVDGGSSDETVERASIANAAIVLETKRGYGTAIRAGINSVKTDFYAIVDADDTYDLSVLPRMLQLAATNKVVIGRRFNIGKGGMSLSHLIGNIVLSAIYRILYGQNVKDSQSGFKIFPAMVATHLKEEGMTLSSEILIVARQLGYDIEEVPVGYRIRANGSKSKFSFWADGITVFRFLISTRFSRYRTNVHGTRLLSNEAVSYSKIPFVVEAERTSVR